MQNATITDPNLNLAQIVDDQQSRSDSLQPTPSTTTSSSSSPPASSSSSTTTAKTLQPPSIRRHRSVKSITREYEVQQLSGPSTSNSQLSPSFSTDHQQRLTTSASFSSSSPPPDESVNHTRRASVLLASASYPSTLSTGDSYYPRPRTISSSSVSARDQDRSPSLKLASAAYPSSYQVSTSPSNSNLPLPLPAGPARSPEMGSKGANVKANSLPTLNVSLSDSIEEDKDEGKRSSLLEEEEDDEVGELSLSTGANASSQMTAAERREHSRKHSRVHSRNLSVFFPRPGSEAEKEADDIRAADRFGRPAVSIQTNGLTSPEEARLGAANESLIENVSPSKSRRGHHRKHSVTHGMYGSSQLHAPDASATSISPSASISPLASSTEPNWKAGSGKDDAADVAGPTASLNLINATPTTPTMVLSSLPASHRPLLLFGTLHFVLGSLLWLNGQSGDSLSMTGLGYLVVFDAFGVLSRVFSDWLCQDWKRQEETGEGRESIRKPYGPHRIETLLQFSQTVFLLFASIYVCKESVEHALLEGADEHHEEDDVGLRLPRLILILASAACLFSNMVFQNHAKLVAACGIATMASEANTTGRRAKAHGRAKSILVDPTTLAGPFLHLLSNPFSITILFFCLTLTSASVFMPPFQVAALDKVLAGLESVAMLYTAYPASKALGKILLQTAPKAFNTQNVQLLRSIRTIEEHPLVTYVAPPHLWQLTPPTSATDPGHYSSVNGANAMLGSLRLAKNATLIASVEVFLQDRASDADVLEVTKWAWRLLSPAVGAGAGLRAGESLRGSIRAGEVSVQVSREGERERHRKQEQAHASEHDQHDHHHGAHSHNHHDHHHGGHSHDHHDNHHGAHSHDQALDHAHHNHSHDHHSHQHHSDSHRDSHTSHHPHSH